MSINSGNSTPIIHKAPRGLLPLLKENFISPYRVNWSYLIWLLAIGTSIGLVICRIISYEDFSSTSLIGYALLSPIFTLFAYIIPSVIAAKQIKSDVFGEYTGIGALILAFISGVPLALVFRVIHNFCAYFHLWSGHKTIFPAMFYYCTDNSLISTITEIIAGTLLPAVGIAIFFYGVMWDRLSRRGFLVAVCLTALSYALVQLNPIDFIGFLFVGAWLSVLRDRTGCLWSIVACLLGLRITALITAEWIQEIDIYSIQTLSDVDNTFLYSSLPAIFFGFVLLLLIRRYLNNFKNQYFTSSMADNLDDKNADLISILPEVPLLCYLPALITGIALMAILWILLIKGVFI